MKVVPMSDLHGHLPKADIVPECDVVCICGDVVPLDYQNDDVASIAWFCLELVPWTDSLKCKKVIFIGGNHDFFLEHIMYGPVREDGTRKVRTASEVLKKLLPGNNKGKHKIIYLRDNSVSIDDKTFYGTPWIGDLERWAFFKNGADLKEIWSGISKECDVLLTHMPPRVGDMGTVLQPCWNTGNNYGSEILYEKLMEREIHHTFCGHVHSGNHSTFEYKEGCFVTNVSIKNEDYCPTYQYFNIYEI